MALLHGARPLSSINRLFHSFHRAILIWEKPFAAALLTGLIFLGIAAIVGIPWRLSNFHYYNYLADAFLHGQLPLRLLPPTTQDLSFYQGQYYLYWGPLPAIILMPFVALFGVGFSMYRNIVSSLFARFVNDGSVLVLNRQNLCALFAFAAHTYLLRN